MNSKVVIFLFLSISLFACNKDTLPEAIKSKLDQELCSSKSIEIKIFDSLLNEYQNSDYLNGMKAYYLCYNVSSKEADAFLKEQIARCPDLEKGTYCSLANACICKEMGNESCYFDQLSISLASDKSNENKWVRLEYFYYYQDRDSVLARKYLSEATKMDKYFTLAYAEVVNLIFSEKKYSKVISICNSILSKYPDYSFFLCSKGDAFMELREFSKARDCYEACLKNDSSYVDARIGLGNYFYFIEKSISKARNEYEQALVYDTTNYIALKKIGSLYIDLGEFSKAEKYLFEAYSINPEYDVIIELIYADVLNHKYNEAKHYLNEVKTFKNDRRYIFLMIVTEKGLGNTLESEKIKNTFFESATLEDKLWMQDQLR